MANSEALCKICRLGPEDDRPLCFPCKCTGSIKYIHQDCLLEWIAHSETKQCELCKYEYKFTPRLSIVTSNYSNISVYKDAPTGYSGIVFFVESLLSLVGSKLKLVSRYIILFSLLAVILPLITASLWKRFLDDDQALVTLIDWVTGKAAPTSKQISELIILGSGICLVILAVHIVLLTVVDYIQTHFEHRRLARQPVQNDPQIRRQIDQLRQNNNIMVAEEDEEASEEEDEDDIFNPVDALLALNQGIEAREVEPVDPEPLEDLLGLRGSLWILLSRFLALVGYISLFLTVLILMPQQLGKMLMYHASLLQSPSVVSFFPFINNVVDFLQSIASPYRLDQIPPIAVGYLFSILAIAAFGPKRSQTMTVFRILLLLIIDICWIPLLMGYVMQFSMSPLFGMAPIITEDELPLRLIVKFFSVIWLWIVGFVTMIIWTRILKMVRDMMRPGMLWFLRFNDDPGYSLFRSLIQEPFRVHMVRIIHTLIFYAISATVFVYIPALMFKFANGEALFGQLSFRSYSSTHADMVIGGLFPFYVDLFRPRALVLFVIRTWLQVSTRVLGLADYLLIREGEAQEDIPRPSHMWFRVLGLILVSSVVSILLCFLFIALPYHMGKFALSIVAPVNEIYFFLLGIYMLSLSAKGLTMIQKAILNKNPRLVLNVLKAAFFCGLVFIVLPFMAGLLMELVVIIPIRVSGSQKPIHFLAQDMLLGVTILNIVYKLVLMDGVNDNLKQTIRGILDDGVDRIDAGKIMGMLNPIIFAMLTMLAIPYLFAHSLILLGVGTPYFHYILLRFVYFYSACLLLGYLAANVVLRHISNFMAKLREDRLLVGRQVQNFEETVPQ